MDIPEISEHVDEVTLEDYVPSSDNRRHREAYDDEDDDEEMGHGHGPGVQCATQ